MEKQNRKITWVHVTYGENYTISIVWVTERWTEGKFVGKRRKEFIFTRNNWTKLHGLLRVARYSSSLRYTVPAYDGWSVCFEVLPS